MGEAKIRQARQVQAQFEPEPEPFKPFLLFAWYQYYPSGGFGDLHGDYDTLEEAQEAAQECSRYDVVVIHDLQTGTEHEVQG